MVEARVHSSVVEFRHNGIGIAQHERSYERSRQILNLEHYLEALEQKPGALRGSKPLEQWRMQGRWPASYDALWELLTARQGRQDGTRAMVGLLRLGCTDVAAIHHLLLTDQLGHGVAETVEIGALAAYERPLPTLSEYNQLLDSQIAAVEVPA